VVPASTGGYWGVPKPGPALGEERSHRNTLEAPHKVVNTINGAALVWRPRLFFDARSIFPTKLPFVSFASLPTALSSSINSPPYSWCVMVTDGEAGGGAYLAPTGDEAYRMTAVTPLIRSRA
jgi:hypothetical protein